MTKMEDTRIYDLSLSPPPAPPPPPGFILGTPLKVYHFLAQSSEEKGVWFSELHSRIFAQKRLFNKVGMYSCMYV